jgi:O-antigen/teichoic acid export membrane protein
VVDIEDEFDRDLESAGSAMLTFSPGGLWGLVVGGLLATAVVVYGYLKRMWRRGRGGHSLS